MDKRPFRFITSLVPFLVMITTMLDSVVVLDITPHIPLIIGAIVAGGIAYFHGYSWSEIEDFMYRGIKLALPALIIILLVGLVIGSWVGGGIVATMIYYGLNIISPNYFLITVVIICSIVSLTIGSAWSTIATVGIASLGIGVGLNIPLGPTAGAIVAGAFFGDKMSPLSDTTNLASGLTHTNIFKHIKHMLYTTVPAVIITLIVFHWYYVKYIYITSVDFIIIYNNSPLSDTTNLTYILTHTNIFKNIKHLLYTTVPAFIITLIVFQWYTVKYINNTSVDLNSIETLRQNISEAFVISPWLLLAPVIVLAVILFKVPPAPALLVGAFLGTFSQLFVQNDTLASSLPTLIDGFEITTSNESIDVLFSRGGMMDMMFVVTMTFVAMSFAGIKEHSGMLQVILDQILKFAKNTFGLVSSALLSAIFINLTCAEHYISIIVPGRMFVRPFVDNNLDTSNLSRTLEDGGTVTSALIPWSTDGVFIYGTLGITVLEYGPFAVMNYAAPIIALILAATGIGIKKITDEDKL